MSLRHKILPSRANQSNAFQTRPRYRIDKILIEFKKKIQFMSQLQYWNAHIYSSCRLTAAVKTHLVDKCAF